MKALLLLISLLTCTALLAQTSVTSNWTFQFNDQQEIVLADGNWEKTFLIYRFGDGSNNHTYDIHVKVDGQFVTGSNSDNITLEEESSIVVRGKKIVLVRDPSTYTEGHIIQGNFKTTIQPDTVLLEKMSVSMIQGNDAPSLLVDLENPRRIRLELVTAFVSGNRPYAYINVDGFRYQLKGSDYKLHTGNAIEVYGKQISLEYPSSAPAVPVGQEFLRGKYSIFAN